VHIQPETPPRRPRCHPVFPSTNGHYRSGAGGRSDTYGSARTAQPGRSQGRPSTNTGSQPIEQDRPAHPASLPAPLSRTVAPYANQSPTSQASGRRNRRRRHLHTGHERHRSLNARYRRAIKARGQFPTEQAALKVLYLAVRNLDEFRSPSVGTRSSGWKQALQAFTIYFEGRIPTP